MVIVPDCRNRHSALSPCAPLAVRRLVTALAFLAVLGALPAPFGVLSAAAHRSGCHRWHSCPSDHGTYECGDLGRCGGCPDNRYCELGKPRRQAKQAEPRESPAKESRDNAEPPTRVQGRP